MDDIDSSALQTIVRLMQKREASDYMKRLKKKPEPKKSVSSIVEDAVGREEGSEDGDSE